jgi:hypothetical protein
MYLYINGCKKVIQNEECIYKGEVIKINFDDGTFVKRESGSPYWKDQNGKNVDFTFVGKYVHC